MYLARRSVAHLGTVSGAQLRPRRMLTQHAPEYPILNTPPPPEVSNAEKGATMSWFAPSCVRELGRVRQAAECSTLNLGLPEVALAGRSNVGKSTLINTLLNLPVRRDVSKQPGKTNQVAMFSVGGKAPRGVLADLPGYGYARQAHDTRQQFHQLVLDYCCDQSRLYRVLQRVMVLVDARLGLTPVDREFLALLQKHEVPYHVVLTKVDSLSTADLRRVVAPMQLELGSPEFDCCHPVISVVSARSGVGVCELRWRIGQALVLGHSLAKEAAALLSSSAPASPGPPRLSSAAPPSSTAASAVMSPLHGADRRRRRR